VNLSPRPSRSRSRLRTIGWIALISFFIVFANAIISAARKPVNKPSAALQFVDQIRPFIDESNAEAAELSAIRAGFSRASGADGPTASAESLQKRLKNLNHDVTKTRNGALDVTPANSVRDLASLVWATFSLRAEAVDSIESSLNAVLDGNQSSAENGLSGVNSQLAVSDSDYRQFQRLLNERNIAAHVPDSVWLGDASAWETSDIQLLIASWKANLSKVAEHNVTIISIVTNPAPIRKDGSVQVLPSQRNMNVTVIVANIGNVNQAKVPVRVRINAADGTSDGKNDSVSLKPGEERTVTFRNIRVVPDGVSTLVVDLGPVANEVDTSDNSKSISFTMNPTAGTTTTVTVATTTTALPGH
jgi:hypothetical protein